MPRYLFLLVVAGSVFIAGCSGQNGLNVGALPDATDNGSYAGSTLNSPVTDQNPHAGGGDPSYPATVSDQGETPPPPAKVDGR